jgi:anti-sigma B factor antagonist
MSLGREQRGDVHVLTPHKSLMGGDETRELRQAVEEIVAQGVPKIVLDLGNISWMNTLGVGSIVATHVSCTKRGGWLRVARVGRRIKDIFLVTWLVLILDTYDSVEEALAAESRKWTMEQRAEAAREMSRRFELAPHHDASVGGSPRSVVEKVR